MFFFDAEGRQIAGFDIAVKRDLNGLRAAMRQILPKSDIRVEGIGASGIVISGQVTNAGEAQQAFDLAARLVGDGKNIVNSLSIKERDQIMLKVTVAEIQRDVLKQLGINITGSLGYGNTVLNFNTSNAFSASGLTPGNGVTGGWMNGANTIQGTLNAMERAGVVRTLAEPNLTAVSGESAKFLAGGKFPIVGGVSCNPPGSTNCTPSIEFKDFGVSLNFTPVVLSEGRISLKVVTEVSELSNEGAITQGGITIPALKVRSADTTVEVPSGGSLALAGMIQEQTKQAINGLPGLLQVPILGTLFKSRDYTNRQTELVVIVTPYVVRAVAQKDLSRPDDGFADVSDPQGIFLGKINRTYGAPRKSDPRRPYHGSFGFIMD